MFESRERAGEDIQRLLEGIRHEGEGRYACLLDRRALLFEAGEADDAEIVALKAILDRRREALFKIPASMAPDGPALDEDVFAGWEHDDLLLVFVNERVVMVVACPDAEALKAQVDRPLKALVDRLFRFDATYRLDAQGSGLLFGRAKVDTIVIAKS